MVQTPMDRRIFTKVASGTVISGSLLSKSGKASGAKTHVWRFVMPFPEGSIPGQTGLFWAKRVEEASNGRIKVKKLGPEHNINRSFHKVAPY
ncbi:MAG: hypothetical protein HRU09_17975 [Oligoflexales bacterium]|nr:hypothetical protein [Oligoflexales bacterium]